MRFTTIISAWWLRTSSNLTGQRSNRKAWKSATPKRVRIRQNIAPPHAEKVVMIDRSNRESGAELEPPEANAAATFPTFFKNQNKNIFLGIRWSNFCLKTRFLNDRKACWCTPKTYAQECLPPISFPLLCHWWEEFILRKVKSTQSDSALRLVCPIA